MAHDDRGAANRIFANVGKAIAAYERRIVSRDAPFDRFVAGLRDGDPGELAALGAGAQRGLALFVGRANCGVCHVGPSFTDGEFHDTGLARGPDGRLDAGRYDGVPALLEDEFNGLGTYSDAPDDPGRLTRFLASRPEHLGQFKTPTLRNVALTAPYMHDGRLATLEDVVRYYARIDPRTFVGHHREAILQPIALDDDDVRDLVAFLESLTGAPVDPVLTRPPSSASTASSRRSSGSS
jgi:cytochrome c peroxidase